LSHGNTGRVESCEPVLAFGKREFFRQHHPVKRGSLRIPEQCAGVTRLPREKLDQPISGFWPADASELLPDDAVLALQRIEDGRDRPDRVGRRQQAQRVTRRGGVDNDPIVLASGANPYDLEHGQQFVDPRDGQLQQGRHIGSIEPCAVFQRVAERLAMAAQPAGEGARCVELHRIERPASASANGDPP
jgi:hypothetical protein